MSEEDVWPDAEQEPEPAKGPTGRDLRDQLATANARLAEVERKSALLEAGVDTKSPIGSLFADAYKGDLTSEAIKEAWEKIVPPAQTPENVLTPAEQQAAENRQALAQQGQSAPPLDSSPDPYESAIAEGRKVMERNGTQTDGMAIAVHRLRTAADAGDQRVIVGRNRP